MITSIEINKIPRKIFNNKKIPSTLTLNLELPYNNISKTLLNQIGSKEENKYVEDRLGNISISRLDYTYKHSDINIDCVHYYLSIDMRKHYNTSLIFQRNELGNYFNAIKCQIGKERFKYNNIFLNIISPEGITKMPLNEYATLLKMSGEQVTLRGYRVDFADRIIEVSENDDFIFFNILLNIKR